MTARNRNEFFTPMVTLQKRRVEIFLNRTLIEGELSIPANANGVVIFVHGIGNGLKRHWDEAHANNFNRNGIGVFRSNLLTELEEHDTATRYNISALAHRLIDVTHWLEQQTEVADKPLGYYAAGMGGAIALKAAAELGTRIRALVLRGGRTNFVEDVLPSVTTPTLLIAGGEDRSVVIANQTCIKHLGGEKQLAIIPGAYHRFEEEGANEEVSRYATEWFERYFQSDRTAQADCSHEFVSK